MSTIAQLTHMSRLNLSYTKVTDAGLTHLSNLGELSELQLDSAAITDVGVATLLRHSRLKLLNLYHTLVTASGFDSLRKALPSCQIVWDRDSALPTRRGS
jgi:hypothetical protein